MRLRWVVSAAWARLPFSGHLPAQAGYKVIESACWYPAKSADHDRLDVTTLHECEHEGSANAETVGSLLNREDESNWLAWLVDHGLSCNAVGVREDVELVHAVPSVRAMAETGDRGRFCSTGLSRGVGQVGCVGAVVVGEDVAAGAVSSGGGVHGSRWGGADRTDRTDRSSFVQVRWGVFRQVGGH